ncbi:BLUF domain-containing protein [Psychrobacter aestuarii]|uniref:BLUF domain-containing protein n=1 Tax=Psychrobacter aestuarii TaxID=556327 RepID=A0ABP3FFD5_9GAMM|nr:BLUF domain-containing protein [Psychrobacter aestuarii]
MDIYTSYPSNTYKRNGEHILISLTYLAKHTDENTGLGLMRELEQWRRYLNEMGIVSILVINDGYFIQNFQGPRPEVNKALSRIVSDYPQISPQVVEVKEIDECQWNGYLIRHLTTSVEDEEHTLKYFSAGHDFNPYMMSNAQIDGFLNAVFKDKKSQGSVR